MKKRCFNPLLILPVFFMAACTPSFKDVPTDTDKTVEEITMNPGELVLKVGESGYIDALIKANVENPKTTWKVSGNQNCISMVPQDDHDGVPSAFVTGLSEGTASVTVNAGNKFATTSVVVTNSSGSYVPVSSVSISDTTKTVYIDKDPVTFTLTSTVLPSNATNKEVVWTTSNDQVATVSKSSSTAASVEVKAVGTATVSANIAGKTASCVITALKQDDSNLKVSLDKTTASIEEGATVTLKATANKEATYVWQSNNQSAATVDKNGVVTGVKAGTATITVTATAGKESDTAQCNVTVTEAQGEDEYAKQIASWSKGGHLYLHYLRENADYDKWAVWMWQKLPHGLEGSLWGATQAPSNIHTMTTSWMTEAETGGTSNSVYCDKYGQVCDIDLTNENIVDGKLGNPSPIIDDWDALDKARIGFLIVDQTKMGGGTHWTSDGGIESYIKKLDEKFPNKKDSYLHIYCVEGSVSSFTTSSGGTVEENPTVKDISGKYRSQNDIINLKADAYTSGVRTSETFLQDEPGTGYQIFVPSFADHDGDGMGDLRGVIDKLDYLDDLGVKVLWLTPIQESDSYHGYDVTDYYKIDSKFGTMEDYQELLFRAHQKGMKVLMDMVINHTSKNNVLFTKSQRAAVETINGKTVNYRDMYLWKYQGDMVREWDGVEPDKKVDPTGKANYVNVKVEENADWYRDGASNYFYYGKFGSGMAELNYSCQATRDYMTDMCKYWLSFGLDGFRLDAIKHIYLASELDPDVAAKYASDNITYDVSYRTAYDNEIGADVKMKNDYTYDRDLNVMFWKQFSGSLKSAYPNCYLVGENFDGWNERVAPFYESIDSQFDFSTYYHLNEMPLNSIGSDIKATLEYNKAYRADHINGAFTSNHDIARMLNHAGADGDASHTSEITSANATLANNRARFFSSVTLLTPGISWIYYGDELGMSGNMNDKIGDIDDHGNNVDRWYRQPMRWGNEQGKDEVTSYIFSGLQVTWDAYNSKLATASAQQADTNSMFNHFKALNNTKNNAAYPTYGYVVWSGTVGECQESSSIQISDGKRTVNIFINGTGSAITIPERDRGTGTVVGCSINGSVSTVPAYGFVVVKVK